MKTELEIANERIIELENQVKKLSLNLPVIKSYCEHDYQRRYVDQESIFVCTKCKKRQGSSSQYVL